MWMFENWLEDKKDNAEITKNHAYLIGSFINPEAVNKLLGDGTKFESTSEDFDESTELVRNNIKLIEPEEIQKSNKRARRILKE